MDRRAVLAAGGAVIGASTAGCLLGQGESEPTFVLRDVRSYRADGTTAIAVATVEKQGEGTGNASIRAELRMADTYDHASEQTFVVPADLDERAVALPFTYDSEFLTERTFSARAKIVRHGAADGDWKTEADAE